MILLLIVSLAATVGTGLIVYAQEHAAGPLAPFIAQTQQKGMSIVEEAPIALVREVKGEGRDNETESAFEEVHETLANVTLGLVIFHVLGVILASFVHRENLVTAMITGRKRPDGMGFWERKRPTRFLDTCH